MGCTRPDPETDSFQLKDVQDVEAGFGLTTMVSDSDSEDDTVIKTSASVFLRDMPHGSGIETSVKVLVAFKVGVFYCDLATDIYFGNEVYLSSDPEAPPKAFFYAVVVCILGCPVVLSVIDMMMRDGMGWRGLILNMTYTRVLYSATKVFTSGNKGVCVLERRNRHWCAVLLFVQCLHTHIAIF